MQIATWHDADVFLVTGGISAPSVWAVEEAMPERFTAARWRERAEEARALAKLMTSKESREGMLEVARKYDTLAYYADNPRDLGPKGGDSDNITA